MTSIIISNDTAALVVESANGAARGFTVLNEATTCLATALGTAPTLELWEAVSNAWKAQYKTTSRCGDDAVNMAWSRMVKRLSEFCMLDKPKATGKSAVKKAESRSESKKAVQAAINAAGGDIVKLAESAAAAIKAGNTKDAAVLSKAAIELQNDAGKAAEKAANDALKDARKKCADLVKTADAAMLEKILGLLSGELVTMKKKTK
jgi:hypothetical protein